MFEKIKEFISSAQITSLTINGLGYKVTVKRMQEFFDVEQTGILEGQYKSLYKYYSAWKAVKFGSGGCEVVWKLQRWLGYDRKDCDGIWGPNTSTALQRKLIKEGYLAQGEDNGIFYKTSMRAWQRYLNEHDKAYPKKSLLAKELEACKTQAEWMKNYTYQWENNPTIEKSKKKGTCVTYIACVLQRIGYLKSGEAIWHDGKGHLDNLHPDKIQIMYPKGSIKANKNGLKAGDVIVAGDSTSTTAGGDSHIFILTGQWDSNNNPYIWDNNSATRIRKGQTPTHTYSGSNKIIGIARLKEATNTDSPAPAPTPEPAPTPAPEPAPTTSGSTYTGAYPLVNRAELIVNMAVKLAWPKGTSTSIYRYPGGSANKAFKNALNTVYPEHNNWGAAPSVGASCDVFVGTVIRAVQVDNEYPRGLEEQFDWKPNWATRYTYKGIAPASKSQDGDIVMFGYDGGAHTVIRGNGMYYEANYNTYFGHTNSSLSRLKQKQSGDTVILRPKNYLSKGDKGPEVTKLQKYLDWYFNGAFSKECGKPDGIFGNNTDKWVKKMQTDFFGASEADGTVGEKTIAKMKAVKK